MCCCTSLLEAIGNLSPVMDTDFAIICSLVRRRRPQIQFLSIGPYLCSKLPSDPTSRDALTLRYRFHLHQVGTGLSPASCRRCAAYRKKWAPQEGAHFGRVARCLPATSTGDRCMEFPEVTACLATE